MVFWKRLDKQQIPVDGRRTKCYTWRQIRMTSFPVRSTIHESKKLAAEILVVCYQQIHGGLSWICSSESCKNRFGL